MAKRLYRLMIVTLLLIAALGIWAMVDGVITFRNRPAVDEIAGQYDAVAQTREDQQTRIGFPAKS